MAARTSMPAVLRAFLDGLTLEQAGAVYDWLDEEPYADVQMLRQLGDSHPGLFTVPKDQEDKLD